MVLGTGLFFPELLPINKPVQASNLALTCHPSIIRDETRFDHSQNFELPEQFSASDSRGGVGLSHIGLCRDLFTKQLHQVVHIPATFRQEEDAPQEVEATEEIAESSKLPVIAADKVKLETIANEESWVGLSDQELKQVIQVSGELKWKGLYRWKPDFNIAPPNFELVLGTRGAKWLDSVFNIGFVKIDSFVDKEGEKHQPLSVPPGVEDPLEDWVFPASGKKESTASKSGRSLFVNLEFPRPEKIPFEAVSVKGSLKLNLATEYEVITINNIAQVTGRLELPELTKRGMEITVSRPSDITIMVEIIGNSKRVADVKIIGDTEAVGETQVVIPGKAYFQIDFLSAISNELDLRIRLVKESRELTLPFEMDSMSLRAER
ncbi:MAG: hypothetical protein P8J33_05500 [Pirellulaceae bacterium]|nr:hypothetical protein [Pirellulaceae bacterium]